MQATTTISPDTESGMAAANVASPTSPMRNHYPPFSSQQSTPISSATATPTNLSPTSPRAAAAGIPAHHLHNAFSRQLHPPKAPLYTPAVLRPTERPVRFAHTKHHSTNSIPKAMSSTEPLTPPSSTENSYDGKSGSPWAEEGLQRKLLAQDGITRVVTDEWNDEAMEEVTGLPTRDHWKPDASSPTCDAPICATAFTFLKRRHHCRRCGNIFCSSHSHYEVPLDQHARFHPSGAMARACDSCWWDYMAWKRRRAERGSLSGSEGSGNATPAMRAGDATASTRRPGSTGLGTASGLNKGKEVIVGSVPKDWSWSTF